MRARFFPLAEQPAEQQGDTFRDYAPGFNELVRILPPDPECYLTPFWQEKIRDLADTIEDGPPRDFLNNTVIRWTMFVPWSNFTAREYAYVEECLGRARARVLLRETPVGRPQVYTTPGEYLSSGNTVHHAYHLVRHSETAKPGPIKTVLEWGCGYGNMARLWKRMDKGATYVCVDTRLFIALTRLYVGSVYGMDAVCFLPDDGVPVPGKVNLVPLGVVHALKMHADLFLSTWSVSEATRECQEMLLREKLYEAKHVLIGHQGTSKAFPFANDVRTLVKGRCHAEAITFLPGNSYLFK